jgi:hypothetical protein
MYQVSTDSTHRHFSVVVRVVVTDLVFFVSMDPWRNNEKRHYHAISLASIGSLMYETPRINIWI